MLYNIMDVMSHVENLKQSLFHQQLIQSHQQFECMKQMMQPIIDKIKLDIIELYPWSEEEIIEKIKSGKVPYAIACCYN